MSHTSAQSSHNPAPDIGPEQSADSIIQWMRKVTAKLVEIEDRLSFLAQVTADANSSIDKRLRVLEGSNTVPMLLDLSTRLEALEEVQEKHNELLFSHAEDFKVLDTRTQQIKDKHNRMADALNNWNNEGGK